MLRNRGTIKNVSKIITDINNFSRFYIVITVFITVWGSIVGPVQLKLLQLLLNYVQKYQIFNKYIVSLLIFYFGISFISIFFKTWFGYYNLKFRENFNLFLKNRILEKTSDLNLKDYENNEVYDLIKRAEYVGENDSIINYFNEILAIVGLLISSISYIIIILQFKYWILPFILIFPVINFFISNIINIEQYNIIKNRTNDERKSWYYEFLITNGVNFKDLKIYGLFYLFKEKFYFLNKKFIKENLYIGKKRFRFILLFDLIEQVINATIFIYILILGVLKELLIGDIITYNNIIISTKDNIKLILDNISNIKKEDLYIDQYYELLDFETEKHTGNIYLPEKIDSIKVINLSYKYDNAREYTLKNINLTIKKGTINAIVGMNGSGKSTLIKILSGFYDDYEGDILINGISLREIDKNSYMKNISILFQDFSKFEATLKENVCWGNVDKNNVSDDENVKKCLYKSGIDENMIKNLPLGIDTQLGYWFDSGINVSSGQWQRIAIARTFMKNSEVIFLDEPNSALDLISEKKMEMKWKKFFENKIGIIVVHRINAMVTNADNIIVMDKGEILEFGTHEELIKNKKIYNTLHEIYKT